MAKVYVLGESNCLYEGLTKEETLAAIEQAVSSGTVGDVDAGFITTIKEQNKQVGVKLWVGTEAEYRSAGKEAGCVYIVTTGEVPSSYTLPITSMQTRLADLETRLARAEAVTSGYGKVLLDSSSTISNGNPNLVVKDITKYRYVEVSDGVTGYTAICNVTLQPTTGSFFVTGVTNGQMAGAKYRSLYFVCLAGTISTERLYRSSCVNYALNPGGSVGAESDGYFKRIVGLLPRGEE